MVSSERIMMTGLINITQEISAAGAVLEKSLGTHRAWDATASSSECIDMLQSSRRGFRFRLSEAFGSNGQFFVIGLMSVEGACPQHSEQDPEQEKLRNSVDYLSAMFISYALQIDREGVLCPLNLKGKPIRLARVKAGDVIEMRLTREDPPKVELCLNGKVHQTWSEGPSKQARLFVKVCALLKSPLVEDLQWILEDPAPQTAEQQTCITEQQTCITEQQTCITEQQTQIDEQQIQIAEQQDQMQHLQDENSALRDQTVQLQEQMEDRLQAASRATTDEKQELQAQLKLGSDEEVKLQARAMQLQGENEALHAVMGELTEQNAQREVRARQLLVQEQLQRQWGHDSETSSEDWERVSSTA